MKITTSMTQEGYRLAKDVFNKKIDRELALNELETVYGMNKGTASDYIQGFKSMMLGETYKRTFNSEATDYFLNHIFLDFGCDQLLKALTAVENHLAYYQTKGNGNLNTIKRILERHKAFYFSQIIEIINGDELDSNGRYLEGQKRTVLVNAYERNIEARNKCIEFYGLDCQICAINFENMYGYLGKGFIHVHHLKLISTIGEEYMVDPVGDLRPVCPNCHAMLHKRNPPYSIEELKIIINNQRDNK